MKKQHNDLSSLQDILNASKLCIDFTKGFTFDSFESDEKTTSAVLHQISIIGEATKRLSNELRSKESQVPWKKMAGMRDILIHVYESIDYKQVWEVIQKDLPDLLKDISEIIKNRGG